MRIVFEFNQLFNAIQPVLGVAEDALSDKSMRNIIFRLAKDTQKLELIGVNKRIVYREFFDGTLTVEPSEDGLDFNDEGYFLTQVNARELLSALQVFRQLNKTKVDSVSVTVEHNGKFIIHVLESEKRDEDEDDMMNFGNVAPQPLQTFESVITLNIPPFNSSILGRLNLTFPAEGATTVKTDSILFHVQTLLPVMDTSGSATSQYSKLTFANDKIIGFNQAFATLMENQLADCLKGIGITYQGVVFLKDIVCKDEFVDIAKLEEMQNLCFRGSNFEAFVVYDTKLINPDLYTSTFNAQAGIGNQHGIVLDRLYLRDVIKRISLSNDAVKIKIDVENKLVKFTNNTFSQEVPFIQSKGMEAYGSIEFKILPSTLDKAIVGADSEFKPQLFMYISQPKNGRGYILNISDSSGVWFSALQVL